MLPVCCLRYLRNNPAAYHYTVDMHTSQLCPRELISDLEMQMKYCKGLLS